MDVCQAGFSGIVKDVCEILFYVEFRHNSGAAILHSSRRLRPEAPQEFSPTVDYAEKIINRKYQILNDFEDIAYSAGE
jgi:hypothetical protein